MDRKHTGISVTHIRFGSPVEPTENHPSQHVFVGAQGTVNQPMGDQTQVM